MTDRNYGKSKQQRCFQPHLDKSQKLPKRPFSYSLISLAIAGYFFSNSALAANLAPSASLPSHIEHIAGTSTALSQITIQDDASGKVKVTLQVPANSGTISAKSALGVTVKQISPNVAELNGTVKQINTYLSNRKTAPLFKSSSKDAGTVELQLNVNDLGQGNSSAGFVNLPEITGASGINKAPAGWQLESHTPDLISGNGAWPGGNNYAVSDIDGGASPYGGNMGLFLERADGSTPAESWKTIISGLKQGEKYTFRLAWQQATVSKTDRTGPIYSGGQLRVVVDGQEQVFSAPGNPANDSWQYADISFVALKSTADIQIGVSSNTGNTDGESIVIDTGPSPLQATQKTLISIISQQSSLAAQATPTTSTSTVKTETTTSTPQTASISTATVTSGYASSGKLVSTGGIIPAPSIDIVPSMVNVSNVTEVAIAGHCLSGANVSISCHNSANPERLLTPAPTAICSTSNAFSTTVNLSSLADDTITCTASQTIGSDTSPASARDSVTKATANMTVANISNLEAPIVGVPYKQTISCTNNGISVAQKATCAISGLPAWAENDCANKGASDVKPSDAISCQIHGTPNSASPINAVLTTGAANDDIVSNNTGKLSSSTGTVLAPVLNPLQATINSKEASTVKVSGQCVANATVHLSCASNGASTNQLSAIPTISCNSDATFAGAVNTSGLADGTVSCFATQTLGAVTSSASLRQTSIKATANMIVPSNVNLAAPIVGTPYNQTISCTNAGTSPATNATCSISGLPSWASYACSPTPPTLVAVGSSIVCRISGTPTSATPIAATITTTSSNNEVPSK